MIKPFTIIENWKEIIIDNIKPGYFISDLGRVYSTISNTFLTPVFAENGYLTVHLQTNTGSVIRKIHRLVMMTFCYFTGCESLQVNHKDGIKYHNYIWNLEWCSPKENINHAINNNLRLSFRGELNPLSKIDNITARKIGELLMDGYNYNYICSTLSVPNIEIIQNIARGKTWSHLFTYSELEKMQRNIRGHYLNDLEYHLICKYFQNHNKDYTTTYGKAKALCTNSLVFAGLDISDTNMRIAKRLYYRYDRPDITSQYIY